MPRTTPPARPAISQKDLKQWRLIERFQKALAAEVDLSGGLTGTWAHPNRKLELSEYLSLYLFGLFNPVVHTMRGLCESSGLERVQREVCGRPVSLGSFSEAQAVVDPSLLEAVFKRLAGEAATPPAHRAWLGGRARVVDSSVCKVLPLMVWAYWRHQGGPQNALRLHVEFDLASGRVSQAKVTKAKVCERKQWEQFAQPGICDIGDRYYGYDYKLLANLQAHQSDFVVRLRLDAQWVEEHCELLTPADRAAGVVWAGAVRLGKQGDGPPVRVIQLLGEEESILIATTLAAQDTPPELVAECYQHRWEVELFFRWLKCILGCRHWLAESEPGVALQVYLALIAAQLLILHTGKRPNKRQMEAIQLYVMGWATVEELMAKLQSAKARTRPAASKKS